MGEENVNLSDGVLYIEGKELDRTRIEPFSCDLNKTIDDHQDELFAFQVLGEAAGEATLSFNTLFDTELFYKLTGLWDWICDNCPNRRVVHLMKHAKKKRVCKKNFRRALHIIGVILDE